MFFDSPEFDKPLRPAGRPGRSPHAPAPMDTQYAGSFGAYQFYDLKTDGLALVVNTEQRSAKLMTVSEARRLYRWTMQ